MDVPVCGPLTADGYGYYVASETVQLHGVGGWAASADLVNAAGTGYIRRVQASGSVAAPLTGLGLLSHSES